MNIKSTNTYWARLYVGSKESYGDISKNSTTDEIKKIIRNWITEENRICVNIIPLTYEYVNGNEPGHLIEFINYPRFPLSDSAIFNKATSLGELLRTELKQNRVTIVFPDRTIMLS